MQRKKRLHNHFLFQLVFGWSACLCRCKIGNENSHQRMDDTLRQISQFKTRWITSIRFVENSKSVEEEENVFHVQSSHRDTTHFSVWVTTIFPALMDAREQERRENRCIWNVFDSTTISASMHKSREKCSWFAARWRYNDDACDCNW